MWSIWLSLTNSNLTPVYCALASDKQLNYQCQLGSQHLPSSSTNATQALQLNADKITIYMLYLLTLSYSLCIEVN